MCSTDCSLQVMADENFKQLEIHWYRYPMYKINSGSRGNSKAKLRLNNTSKLLLITISSTFFKWAASKHSLCVQGLPGSASL